MKDGTRRPARASMPPFAGLLLGCAILGLLPGCSGGPIGACYEAERACWNAGRMEQRLGLRLPVGADAMVPAMRAYERVLVRYPLAAAGSDPGLRQSLTRSRILAARRLAGLHLGAGQGAQAVRVLWNLRQEALVDPTAAVGFYVDLLQALTREESSDSLATACREMYLKLPPAQPDGSPVVPVLQAPMARINAYASAGRAEEAAAAVADALSYYDDVAKGHPSTSTEVVALTLKADLLARTRRVPEAVAVLERARSLPTAGELAPGIGFLLGQLLEKSPGTIGAATRIYDEVLRVFPGKPASVQAGIRLAMLMASAGQSDSALVVLDRVDRDSPRDLEGAAQARFHKGLVLASAGRKPEAIRELRAVATDYPRTRAGLLAPLQAAEYYRANRDSLAMRATLLEAEQGYERLIQDLRADPAQGPLVMTAIDRLAETRLRLHEWARLAQLLDDRATAFPGDPLSPSALAQAAQLLEEKLDDRQGSIRTLQNLIERYPEHTLAKAAKSKIKQLSGSGGS